ncbi:hypothetical protein [Sulfuricurvum sp.]|uniref:hypothetical protein n=1 Tax=Sulfuricurvum sp. TaxID=2025608 RepID=UPI003C66CB44
MKRSLGRLIVVSSFFAFTAWGATFQWRVLESPKSLYVHQSGVIRYECGFSDSAAEYTVAFKPQSSAEYNVEILTQRDRVSEGKRFQTFDVLITPKREGAIRVNLDALVRHTTFASIENATIGRDNVKKYDFNDEKAVLPPVTIEAKGNSAALTGNIALSLHVDHQSVRAHEPVHLSLYVKGSGNLDQFVPYELNISGVKVFAEPPQKNLTPSADGFEGEIRQEFALVAEKSFVVPPLSLSVLDTASGEVKTLSTETMRIEVGEGYAIGNLLDPPDLSDTATLKRYGFYAVLVIFGMALGEGFRWFWKHRPRRKINHFWERAKSTKELVMLLALSGDKRYESIVAELEKGSMSLREAKNKLSTLTSVKEVKA